MLVRRRRRAAWRASRASVGPRQSAPTSRSRRGKNDPPRRVLTVTAAARVIRTTRRNRFGNEIAPTAGDECLAAAAGDRSGSFLLAAPDHAAHRSAGSDWRGPTDTREGDADERASRTRPRWAHRADPTVSAVTRVSTKTSLERGQAAAPPHSSPSLASPGRPTDCWLSRGSHQAPPSPSAPAAEGSFFHGANGGSDRWAHRG
jgi:hypothetical protein